MELIDVAVTRLAGHEGTVEVSHRAAGCRRGLEFGEVVMLRGGDGQTCLARVADIGFEVDDRIYHVEPVVPATVDGLNALLEELDLPDVDAPAPRSSGTVGSRDLTA
jgi:hypothetical protein